MEAANHVEFRLVVSGVDIFRDHFQFIYSVLVASPELHSVPRLKGRKVEFTSRKRKNPGLQDVSEFAVFCSLGSFASKA